MSLQSAVNSRLMLVQVENRMVTSIQWSLVDGLLSFGCHSVQKTARQKKARLVTSVMLRPGKQGTEGAGCSRPGRADVSAGAPIQAAAQFRLGVEAARGRRPRLPQLHQARGEGG